MFCRCFQACLALFPFTRRIISVAQPEKDSMSYENQILTWIIASLVFVTIQYNKIQNYCYFYQDYFVLYRTLISLLGEPVIHESEGNKAVFEGETKKKVKRKVSVHFTEHLLVNHNI